MARVAVFGWSEILNITMPCLTSQLLYTTLLSRTFGRVPYPGTQILPGLIKFFHLDVSLFDDPGTVAQGLFFLFAQRKR